MNLHLALDTNGWVSFVTERDIVFACVYVCFHVAVGNGVIVHITIVSAGFDKIAAGSTNECLTYPFFLCNLMCAAGKCILKGPFHDKYSCNDSIVPKAYSLLYFLDRALPLFPSPVVSLMKDRDK